MQEDAGSISSMSRMVIPLLKGPVYRNRQSVLWEQLLQQQAAVVDYLSVLGMQLYIDEAEGYAFLLQDEFEGEEDPPPHLIQRRPLGFAVSVLCLILRQWLLEHDTRGGEIRAIIERRQIREELTLFLPAEGSEAKVEEAIDRHIRKVEELGLLKALKDDNQRFEIQRITKALINAEWLGDLSQKLEEYRQHVDSIR